MSQTLNASTPVTSAIRHEPGVPIIRNVNWGGFLALYIKEVRRFFKVQLQTIWAPAITTLLYLAIFTVALGGRHEVSMAGKQFGFADFIAPGLIMMGMMTASFANASFSLLVGKIQGTIVDYLMPPLSVSELLLAMAGAAVTRALCVGLAVGVAMLLWPDVHLRIAHPLAMVYFALSGTMLLALIGLLTSIWAEKFDHAAAVTNFVIAPLSLLSGTFYAIDKLSPGFQAFSRANPFHYAISGFRYAFLDAADSPVMAGAIALLVANIVLGLLTYALLRSGWKLKA